jgi:hypothetical protein
LPKNEKESFIVSIREKGDEMDCINYRRILFLSTLNKILSNMLQTGVISHAN